MRTGAVLALLAVVLTASALDLALGVLWVLALLGVLWLRRRVRLAPVLLLLGTATLLVWGARLGWFPHPAPASYERGWVPAWGGSPPTDLTGDPTLAAAREQLAALSRDELRLTGAELEQRAGALITLSRRIDPLRRDVPREVAAVEAAARRLARTLAASEFRDLETRRAALAGYLAELDRRLGTAHDGSEAASVLRAVDPAAMAHVSLRPVREDLAAAGVAVEGLVRALGGGVPVATVTATARLDDGRKEVRWEVRYAVAGAPAVRLLRVEMRAFRSMARGETSLTLSYAAGEEGMRPAPPGAWLELEPAPRSVAVVRAWTEPAPPGPVRSTLRPIAFEQLELSVPGRAEDALLTVAVDGRGEIEIPLVVRLRSPRLARILVPRYALYFASGPGAVAPDPEGDAWVPSGENPASVRLELVPRSVFLRNGAFASVRDYLYRPNPGAVAASIGLSALAIVLIRRPRPVPVEGR